MPKDKKILAQQTKEKFCKLLSITDRFIDAKEIMVIAKCTDVTARKCMKILIETNMVESVKERSPKNGNMRLSIRSKVAEITDELLDNLRKYQIEKYSSGAIEAPADAYEFGKNGVYKMMTRPSKEIEKKMQDTVAYDRRFRKNSKLYASGSSLSAVMLSANY